MRRLYWHELPPIAPPVDATDAAAFPEIAAATAHARKLREQWPENWRTS